MWLSLHTDSETEAERKSVSSWDQMIAAWEAKLAGSSSNAAQRFEAALDLAAARGFRYMNGDQVGKLPLEDLAARMDSVAMRGDEPDMAEASAVLSGSEEPAIRVTFALGLYWALSADRAIGKSEDQLRRWRNPRINAVRNLSRSLETKRLRISAATTCWISGHGCSTRWKAKV